MKWSDVLEKASIFGIMSHPGSLVGLSANIVKPRRYRSRLLN